MRRTKGMEFVVSERMKENIMRLEMSSKILFLNCQ